MGLDLNKYHPTQYWRKLEDNRIECLLCPRFCKLREGQQGLCFVRARHEDQIVLTSYGRSSGFCVDPIEKKPLNHFYPGSSVLSFGTAGCNLACKFCQNWDMSKSREMDTLASQATPEQLALKAKELGCTSIAYTYNDPIIFLEYAVDVAAACKEVDVCSVAVTAGYMTDAPREKFFSHMDAANVDLKAFTEKFYRKICGGELGVVLETLEYIKRETDVWLELTTLLIPGENDSEEEITHLCEWVCDHLGVDTPMHFTAFHPDWKMLDKTRTPETTLLTARRIAQEHGIEYVYVGNVHNIEANSTYCSGCGSTLIERVGYEIYGWGLNQFGTCSNCDLEVAGRFEKEPGRWGARRLPVRM